jgi:hypothetical protein
MTTGTLCIRTFQLLHSAAAPVGILYLTLTSAEKVDSIYPHLLSHLPLLGSLAAAGILSKSLCLVLRHAAPSRPVHRIPRALEAPGGSNDSAASYLDIFLPFSPTPRVGALLNASTIVGNCQRGGSHDRTVHWEAG